MIAHDKNSLVRQYCIYQFRDMRTSSKELLESTVTTDHGTMQRFLPVTCCGVAKAGVVVQIVPPILQMPPGTFCPSTECPPDILP